MAFQRATQLTRRCNGQFICVNGAASLAKATHTLSWPSFNNGHRRGGLAKAAAAAAAMAAASLAWADCDSNEAVNARAGNRPSFFERVDAVEDFFASTKVPEAISAQRATIEAFVAKWSGSGHPIAVVTSGGTTVPLERNTVRFVDNFSTGTRGSLLAEHLLAHGYAVLYVHRDSAVRPFMKTLSSAVHDVESWDFSQPSSARVPLTKPQIESAQARQAALKSGLYEEVKFNSVVDYLHVLRLSSCALQAAGSDGMLIMAAAVSDFYLPDGKISEHKIQSKGGGTNLELDLYPVPKLLGYVTHLWGPSNFNVSFKLETDAELLYKKATGAARAYKVDAVVANMLQTRTERVDLFAAASPECKEYTQSVVNRPRGAGVVEGGLVQELARLHAVHRGKK